MGLMCSRERTVEFSSVFSGYFTATLNLDFEQKTTVKYMNQIYGITIYEIYDQNFVTRHCCHCQRLYTQSAELA